MASSLLYSDCYGDVYKYKKDEDIHLVKIIKSNNLKSKNKLETLDAMKKLTLNTCKNLSEYIDFYFNDNNDFEILMEYDEDSEFEKKIKYNKENHLNFEEDYKWSLAIQILNLLKYIQQNKNFKIEINPSKILLMNNGILKIFDYGMDLISNMGLSSSILQNLNDDYITPPEYMKEDIKKIDEDSANIWKAGCIIYELFTLNHVFYFESMFDMQVKLSNFKGIYEIDSKYDNDFKLLLSKMLIAEPEKRATVDELLNCEIIKLWNNNILEKERLEKQLINASIFTFKQSILKNSLKDSIRQIKNQNEMMENDNYEILKLTMSKNKELNEDKGNINYLKQTGKFGDGIEKENENVKNKDFKEILMAEKIKKEGKNIGIIEKNNYNYNNPFRINNYLNNNEKLKVINKKNDMKNNKELFKLKVDKNNDTKNNKEILKLKVDKNIQKERERTPLCETKNNRYFLDVDKNMVDNKNKSKPKNKENKSKDFLPKVKNIFPQNRVAISNDWKVNFNKNNNINNINLTKKTEQVLKLFKVKKINKNEDTNKLKKPNNNYNNKLSSMTNSQIDAIINNMLHRQNINIINKIQKSKNFIKSNNNINNINNINNNKNAINISKPFENKMKIKQIPFNKPLKNLPFNKNTKISYGTVEYKTRKGKGTKFFVKK